MSHELLKFLIQQAVTLLVGLAWPLLFALIFLGVTWCFRPQVTQILASFAKRSWSVGPKGLEVSAPADQPPGEENPPELTEAMPVFAPRPAPEPGAAPPPLTAYFDPAYREVVDEAERTIEERLPMHMHQLGLSREAVLKLATIDYSIALHFERAARSIFQSQVDALRFLAQHNEMTLIQLRSFYTMAANLYPQQYATYPFESWANFLVTWALLRVDGERVISTPAGRAILAYMTGRGYLNTPLLL